LCPAWILSSSGSAGRREKQTQIPEQTSSGCLDRRPAGSPDGFASGRTCRHRERGRRRGTRRRSGWSRRGRERRRATDGGPRGRQPALVTDGRRLVFTRSARRRRAASSHPQPCYVLGRHTEGRLWPLTPCRGGGRSPWCGRQRGWGVPERHDDMDITRARTRRRSGDAERWRAPCGSSPGVLLYREAGEGLPDRASFSHRDGRPGRHRRGTTPTHRSGFTTGPFDDGPPAWR